MKSNMTRMGLVLAATLLTLFGTLNTALAWTISGTIYGGSNPLADAKVTVYNAADQSEVGSSTTGVAVNYSVTVSNGTYNLLIAPPAVSGLANSVVNGVVVNNSDVTQNVVLLSQAVFLNGTVKLPNGTPASKITVDIYKSSAPYPGGQKIATCLTDATGTYTFALEQGTYNIAVGVGSGSNAGQFTYSNKSIIPNLNLTDDTVQDIVLPYVTISGKTINSVGGTVGNVSLVVQGHNESAAPYWRAYGAGTVVSDSTGNYSLFIPAQTTSVTATPQTGTVGVAVTSYSNLVFSADTNRDFLLSAPFILNGTVKLPNGTPASKITVDIYKTSAPYPGGQKIATCLTDATGTYSFALEQGAYNIAVGVGSGSNAGQFTYSNKSIVPNLNLTDDTVQDIVLPYVTISGKTINSVGGTVGNISLVVQGHNESAAPYWRAYGAGTVVSDSTGNYSLFIPAQTTSVTATPQTGTVGVAVTSYSNLVFSADTNRDFLLSVPFILNGTVKLPNGTPASKITVDIYKSSAPYPGGQKIATCLTDATGMYSFALEQGTYNIAVGVGSGSNIGQFTYSNKSIISSFNLTYDTVQDIVLPYVTISGKTTDSNGAAVKNISLAVQGHNESAAPYWRAYGTGTVVSDSTGNYFLFIPAQTTSLTITPPTASGFQVVGLSNANFNQSLAQNIILNLPDTKAPIILSGPTVSSISDTTAVIEWQTNEPTTGSVNYGSSDPPNTVVASANAKTIHSVPLTGLNADSQYYIKVQATDTSNNGPTASAVISFRTKPTPDTKAPVIIEGPVISSVTHSGAVVEWRTDEPSTGSVSYGLTDSPDQALADATLSTTHRVSLAGIAAETLHYVKVTATDAVNNGPTASPLISFTTQAAPDTTAPVIVEGPLATNISAGEATIVWKTDEPATSGISWNDGTAYGLVTDEGLVLDHNLRITGLLPSTTYNFTVSSKDISANGPTLSKTFTFTTPAAADTIAPVIIEGPLVVNVTHQSAVIRWETDEPADSVIEYGTTTSFGESDSRAALTKPHNLTLTGLAAGTTYYFRVLSRDAAGNLTTALGPYTFSTDAQPGNSKPVLTVEPQIIYQTDTSATIYWETDKPTDTVVDYGKGSSKDKQRAEAAKTTKHQVTLVNLEPEQGYGLSISSTDLEGNTVVAKAGQPITFMAMASQFLVSSIISDAIQAPAPVTGFMTNSAPDITPPIITEAPSVIVLTNKLAIIRWVTDEISDSRVLYGLQEPLTVSAGDIRQGKVHTVVLTNLLPGTTYSFRVGSVDPKGNGPTYSQTLTFITASADDSAGPVFTSTPVVSNITESGATITWATDEPATTQIKYGSSKQLLQQAALAELTTSHSVILTGLQSGNTYFVAAVSTDGSGNSNQSASVQFNTISPTRILTVTLLGGGSGTVLSSTNASGTFEDIHCPGTRCSTEYSAGSQVTLTATPGSTSIFEGWGGDCTAAPCSFAMDGFKSVSATFVLAPVAKNITKSRSHSALATALSEAESGNEIDMLDTQLDGLFMLNTGILLSGGWNTTFTGKSGMQTVLNGGLTIQSGDSSANGLEVKGQLILKGGSLRVDGVTVKP